jgi:modification methylase
MSLFSAKITAINGLTAHQKAITKLAQAEEADYTYHPQIMPFLNRIHCGDVESVMRKLPRESVDLIVTSPPYNLKNSTGNGLKNPNGGRWANAALVNGYATHHDNMPHADYVKWQRRCLRQMMRVLKPDGAIFYNHKWRVQNGLLQDRQDILKGFPVRQIIIWQRAGGINFNPGYFVPTYEVIYLIAKPKFRLKQGANGKGDVWRLPQEMNNPHPAAFPVNLIEQAISATEAQVILDPFMGSGTTAIAAINLKRDYIGIELAKEYVTMAEERIARHTIERLTAPSLIDLKTK